MKRARSGPGWFVARALASPWIVAVALAVAVALRVVAAVASDVAAVAPATALREQLVAQLVADDAALAAFGRRPGRLATELGEVAVDVQRDAGALYVRVTDAATTQWFVAEALTGAPPAALTRPLTVGTGGEPALPAAVVEPELARSAPRAAATTPCAAALGLVARDPAIALQWFVAGTDRDDFVFADGVDLARGGGLVAVPGHLWLESGVAPRVVRATRDVVVLVRGNVYLGRSLRVEGGGRLLLAALADGGATSFADVDGDGRRTPPDRVFGASRSDGPIEGAGSVFTLAGAAPLACGAGLWADGCLHLRRALQCDGPVALVHGVVPQASGAELVARGRWRCHAERGALAGFPATGGARPGFLRACPPPGGDGADKVPLYLSGPLR